MEENNLGPNSNFIPKIFANANNKNNKTPKDIKDKDLREAAEKKEDKIVKQKPKNGMNYGVNQNKATPKFAMNTIFQKGKDKVYGAIDLLKSKID